MGGSSIRCYITIDTDIELTCRTVVSLEFDGSDANDTMHKVARPVFRDDIITDTITTMQIFGYLFVQPHHQ